MSVKHNITCLFEDGVTSSFESTAMETVYQAALRNGLMLETDCREGACGVCKASLAKGECEIGDVSEEALPEDEQKNGFILSCQARARSDILLEFGYPISLLNKEVVTTESKVEVVERVAENVIRLILVSAMDFPSFLPGQYANITVPGTAMNRSFSFANCSSDGKRAEFFIRLLEQGVTSNWLRKEAKVGDTVYVQGPYGQFFLRPKLPKHIVMVAGGTGLAPMLSMLEQLRNNPERPSVTLLYGCNCASELFGAERVASYGDFVDFHQVVLHGEDTWTGPTGYVTGLLTSAIVTDVENTEAYLCGPPPMIEAAREKLAALGLPTKSTFAEKFIPSSS